MKRNVPPVGMVPLSNVVPSSLVTVWGADDTFFQMTVVPAVTVRVAGLKPKLPSLFVTIMIICVPDTGFVCVVGVAVGVVPAVAVTGGCDPPVGAGMLALACDVLLPPHPVSKSMAPMMNRQHQIDPRAGCKCVYFSFISLLSYAYLRTLPGAVFDRYNHQ